MKPRILRLTTPHTHGDDVKVLQRSLIALAHQWGATGRVIDLDGELGQQTWQLLREITYGLGIERATIEHGVSPFTLSKIRHPGRNLTADEKRRRDAREDWRHRYVTRWHEDPVEQGIAWLRAQLGTVETPAGSNRGPKIDKWNLAVGTPPGPAAYWCGALANAFLVACGFEPQHFMAYCPAIEQHARAEIDGWRWVSPTVTPHLGWLVLFTEKGVAGHVEPCVAVLPDKRPKTIGGNTSRQGSSSSMSNGGGVFEHDDRYLTGGFPIRGYAVPPFQKLVKS